MARKGGGGGWLGWIGGTLGEVSLALGELEEAEQMFREALENGIAVGDDPLVGILRGHLAWVLLLRGRLDEAEEVMDAGNEIRGRHPEPQIEIPMAGIAGELSLARGREQEAWTHLVRGVELASMYNVDQDPQVELGLIRLSIRRGERAEAERVRVILSRGRAPFATACVAVADGLLADDPEEALRRLRDGTERLEALGTSIDLARALLDLGRAERRAGIDPRRSFERARELLIACDAQLHIPEADAELSADA